MAQIRIMLVDDHEVVRMGMRALLERHDEYTVVAEASDEMSAVKEAAVSKPEIILMDIRLADGSGIEACRQIKAKQSDIKIIMLTSYAEDELLFSAIQAGAIGYVLKQADSRELLRAIKSAVEGGGVLDPSLTQRVFEEVRRSVERTEADRFVELSDKEKQVLLHLSEGETNKEIAEQLYLSEGTVRNYVSHIFSKLNVANRAEAAAYAIQHHLKDNL
ncbi:MAG: response regulator transcription factor [Chloroflexota bacterium]